MITVTFYGLDQFVVGNLSRELTPLVAKLYEVSEDDVIFIAPEAMVFHKGTEQTSWNILIKVNAPKKVSVLQDQMAQLMMQKQYGDATVTVCHSRSKTLKDECRAADIIIAAIGQPDFVTADMVKEGAVIVDVGTTRVPDASKKSGFRLNGDVKYDEVAPKCSYITPVPGGVGPMTICSLMKNTLAAGKKEYYKK